MLDNADKVLARATGTIIAELTPSDGRKSFYGKAHIFIEKDGRRILKSYSTYVAYIDKAGKFHRIWSGWSATTGRHLRAFAGINKATWDKMPVENW